MRIILVIDGVLLPSVIRVIIAPIPEDSLQLISRFFQSKLGRLSGLQLAREPVVLFDPIPDGHLIFIQLQLLRELILLHRGHGVEELLLPGQGAVAFLCQQAYLHPQVIGLVEELQHASRPSFSMPICIRRSSA